MCNIFPKTYNKEEFLDFLYKNNIENSIIISFTKLPNIVNKNNNEFKLYICRTWYNIDDTYYTFEINYYCEDLIEYLFSIKIFTDIKLSVNNVLCDLINSNYIKK